MLDVDEGRGGDEGEHAAERKAHAQHVAQRPGLQEDAPIGAEHLRHRLPALRRRKALGNPPQHREQAQRGEGEEHGEHRAPAGGLGQQTAQQRRHQGGEHGHQVHQRKHPRRLLQGEQVAHYGPRQHRGRRPAQGLEETPGDQRRSRAGEQAAEGGQQVQADAAQQQAPAAEAVRQRPVEQHAQAQAGEEQADGQLHLGGPGGQVAGDQRQAGEVGVDGQGREGDQRGQGQDQALGVGWGGHGRVRVGAEHKVNKLTKRPEATGFCRGNGMLFVGASLLANSGARFSNGAG